MISQSHLDSVILFVNEVENKVSPQPTDDSQPISRKS